MRHLFVIGSFLLLGCTADTFVGDDGGGGDSGPNNDVVDPPDGDPPSEASTKDGDAGTTNDAPSSDVADVTQPITYYRIFATSQTHTANLGGLSGADAICTSAGAKLGGTGHWKAWLSSTTTDAKTRLFHSTLPYVRTDGVQIASDWTHLTNGTALGTPICLDENGNDVNGGDAGTRWAITSTDEYGTWVNSFGTCADYTTTSTASDPQMVVGSTLTSAKHVWTAESAWSCAMPASLYCVEQP